MCDGHGVNTRRKLEYAEVSLRRRHHAPGAQELRTGHNHIGEADVFSVRVYDPALEIAGNFLGSGG